MTHFTRTLILAAALLSLATTADASRRGNGVSGYDPSAPRHGINVVTVGGGNDVIYGEPTLLERLRAMLTRGGR